MHEEIAIPVHARLTVAEDGVTLIQPHPSAPTSTTGYIVARVIYSTTDNLPSEESRQWAALIARAVNEYIDAHKTCAPRN